MGRYFDRVGLRKGSREWVDGNPVIPLDEAIDHMRAYRVNYEPALEMIADEYDVDIDASHEDDRLADGGSQHTQLGLDG